MDMSTEATVRPTCCCRIAAAAADAEDETETASRCPIAFWMY
jgi:hypothetical protein